MTKSFIDTSGFYALLVSNDRYHTRAVSFVEGSRRKKLRFVSTDYVLDETITLFRARQVSQQIPKLFDLIDRSAFIAIEWIGEERFREARKFVLQHADHDYSFTDCVSFTVMRELKIHTALTTDSHFKEAGFAIVLG